DARPPLSPHPLRPPPVVVGWIEIIHVRVCETRLVTRLGRKPDEKCLHSHQPGIYRCFRKTSSGSRTRRLDKDPLEFACLFEVERGKIAMPSRLLELCDCRRDLVNA